MPKTSEIPIYELGEWHLADFKPNTSPSSQTERSHKFQSTSGEEFELILETNRPPTSEQYRSSRFFLFDGVKTSAFPHQELDKLLGETEIPSYVFLRDRVDNNSIQFRLSQTTLFLRLNQKDFLRSFFNHEWFWYQNNNEVASGLVLPNSSFVFNRIEVAIAEHHKGWQGFLES